MAALIILFYRFPYNLKLFLLFIPRNNDTCRHPFFKFVNVPIKLLFLKGEMDSVQVEEQRIEIVKCRLCILLCQNHIPVNSLQITTKAVQISLGKVPEINTWRFCDRLRGSMVVNHRKGIFEVKITELGGRS